MHAMHLVRLASRSFVLAVSFTSALALAQTQAAPSSGTSDLLAHLRESKHTGDVALSPDGETVAMEVAGSLVLAPVGNAGAGHPAALCSTGKSTVSALTWSPDSTHLAVLADCAGISQVLVTTPNAGAKPKTLATLHGFAKALEYAPDGRSLGLLYVEGASRPSGALAAMKPPSGEIGVEGLEVQRVATLDAQTGQLAAVTPPGLHVYEFSFSRDSKQIAMVAAAPPGENNWWIAKLYTQGLAAGTEPKVVLDPNTVSGPLHGLQIAVPRWSPDGSKIALIGGLMSDQGATGGDLYLLPSDGSGSPVNFTENAQTTVQWIHFLPSGKLLATVIDGGGERVDEFSFTFPPDFKAPAGTRVGVTNRLTDRVLQKLPYSVGDGRLAGSFAVSGDGTIAAWAASSYAAAPEIYAGPLGSSSLPAMTHLNADEKPSWGKAESITWTNDNFHVQGWLLYPAGYDPAKKYGLIVMVHGGPSSAVTPRWPRAGFGAAPLAASGYFVLEPNPRGSYGQGEAFTQANRKDFGYGDLRDILAGVDAVEKQIPAIDDHRLGLTGWSYGGFMTMFGVTQTHRFKAAVAGAGISDWLSYYGENSIDQWMTPFFGATVYKDPAVYAKSSAIEFIDKVTTPTLVVVGDRDGECPAPQSFEFWHALKALNIPTTLVVYPDEGHGFVNPDHQRDVLERSIKWFNQYLQ
jgi:dipeptidyl aminopeptidase/acylaminoacyl peptidase